LVLTLAQASSTNRGSISADRLAPVFCAAAMTMRPSQLPDRRTLWVVSAGPSSIFRAITGVRRIASGDDPGALGAEAIGSDAVQRCLASLPTLGAGRGLRASPRMS
jgi:hypothetical protein